MEEIRYSEVLKESLRHSTTESPSNYTTIPFVANLNNEVTNTPFNSSVWSVIVQSTTEIPLLYSTDTLRKAINVTMATKSTNSNSVLTENNYVDLQMSYIITYTIFIILCIILVASRSILFYKICMSACRGLHNKMFGNILKAPMRFFDTNPSGT